MTDFFDWLTAADSGLSADRLREHFKLSEEEMRRTSEALAPAFLLALQRLAAQPAAWRDFLAQMSALGPAGTRSGALPNPAAFLGTLFGTGALADSVARQASMMAGVSPDTIAKMMPEIGAMTVRTMMRMAGTPGAAPFTGGYPGDAAGQAAAEMMRRSANAVEAFSRPAGSSPSASASSHAYLDRLFADALSGGFPWMAAPPPDTARRAKDGKGSAAEAAPSPFFAFAPLFQAFAQGAAASPGNRASGKEAADDADRARAQASVDDPFAGFVRAMEAGRTLQQTYAQEMLALFDRHRRTD